MFETGFRRSASLFFLVNLLAGSVSALAQDSVPSASTYRGEIRRGVDGRLTVQQAPEPAIRTQAEAGESLAAGNDAAPRSAMPFKRVDPGPPDLSCLAGGKNLSATERTLVSMPADSWLSLPGTAFGTFCRLHESKQLRAVGGCDMVIEAWSGGVYDERRQQLLVIGGGHNDYWGNEVYGFIPANGKWAIVKPASPLGPSGEPSEPMPDGNPLPRHTYDGLAYMSHLGEVVMFGGASTTWSFDSGTTTWRSRSKAPNNSAGHYYMATAYDRVTRTMYVRDNLGLYAYDPDADRWSEQIFNFGRPPYYPRFQTYNYRRGVVMPRQRLFVALGGVLRDSTVPDVFIYHLDRRQDVTPDHPMSGDTSVISVRGIGLDVDTATGSLVAWAGGAPAIMDPATWHWRRGSARGAPPQAVGNGTYGRFRYVPYLNVFILVNRPEEDVHFYKLSGGCGKMT